MVVPSDATQNTGKKTSKTLDFIFLGDLKDHNLLEISEKIFFEVYSPVSARPSLGINRLALLENRQVAEAGKSSSAA